MSGSLLLAHDLGTSGNKATLFNTEGELLFSKTSEYPTFYSNVTWAEQDPLKYWEAVCSSTKAILEVWNAEEIGVVTFSGMMMGCLPVDKKGRPLKRHIIYSDQRAIKQADYLLKEIEQSRFFEITGHRASPSYSLAKLMWLRDNEPEIYRNTYKMLNAKDYMNYRLTGKMVTDYNDASGTNAFDLHNLKWSEEILQISGIDITKFPDAVSSIEVIGEVTSEASRATGLKKGTLVVAGAGDGGCATVGIGSVRPGITYNYIGSSSWISTTSTKVLKDPEMQNFTWAHPVPGYLQPCGTMQTAGSSYSWLKENLGDIEVREANQLGVSPYDILNSKVELSPVGANGVIFLPYLLGERSPRWNPDAKGAFIGLTLERTKADMIRSVLEGITMNLKIILDTMKNQIPIEEIRVLGGGPRSKQWCRILADVYGLPILIPKNLEEATSMGAAVIGGVGSGLLNSFDCVDTFLSFSERIDPIPENVKKYRSISRLFDLAYTSLEPLFKML